jgi:glycosyltransferase involved in cell wall biosynthesis
MKIGIDISQIVYGTGVSFYTRNLIKALAKIDQKNDYLLIGTSLRRKKELAKFSEEVQKINPRFKNKLFNFPLSLAQIWGNKWRLGFLETLTGPLDVFHSSDWIEPPSKARKITTLHDFGFFRYPRSSHPQILAVMKRRLELVKKEVNKIICVSRSTATDAVEFLKVSPKKLEVVYEAPGKEFKKVSEKRVSQAKNKYGLKGKYLLAVATIEPRKNFPGILEAFTIFLKSNPDFSLVIVGKLGWDKVIARIMAKTDRVTLTGYIPTSDLVSLYNGAQCLLFPSLYEGFGLPILEAMACGCPVVTSNTSSMAELVGKSAILVNPSSPEKIAIAINQALRQRPELVRRGLERAKKFTWERAARQTLKVYEKAFQKSKN